MNSMPENLVWTRLLSHRANDKARRLLNFKPQGYNDFETGYLWCLTPEDLEKLRPLGFRKARLTREPTRCWPPNDPRFNPTQPYETP